MNHHRTSRRIEVRQILLGLAIALPVLIQLGAIAEPGEVPARRVGGVCVPLELSDPAFGHRRIAPFLTDQVIQLTYDPNRDGVPDPFDIRRIEVFQESLNVGVKFESGAIGVYRNLRAHTIYNLLGGERVVRVTLEASGTRFTVDNIAIIGRAVGEPPEACTINFDDRASLQAIHFADLGFTSAYSQCNVTVLPYVNPADDQLGGTRYHSYALTFEDRTVIICEPGVTGGGGGGTVDQERMCTEPARCVAPEFGGACPAIGFTGFTSPGSCPSGQNCCIVDPSPTPSCETLFRTRCVLRQGVEGCPFGSTPANGSCTREEQICCAGSFD